jgi:hypothetical protein
MAEYIDRDMVINKRRKMSEYDEAGWCVTCQAVRVEDIENTPSADVVEVVRCKDCKFAFPYRNYYYCENEDSPFTNSDWAVCLNGYDFCSYGERRSE